MGVHITLRGTQSSRAPMRTMHTAASTGPLWGRAPRLRLAWVQWVYLMGRKPCGRGPAEAQCWRGSVCYQTWGVSFSPCGHGNVGHSGEKGCHGSSEVQGLGLWPPTDRTSEQKPRTGVGLVLGCLILHYSGGKLSRCQEERGWPSTFLQTFSSWASCPYSDLWLGN